MKIDDTHERPDLNVSVINLRVLKAASAFASSDEQRYYLNGVCIEFDPRGATYIATDGTSLISFREDLPPNEQENRLIGRFIVPTPHCKPFKLSKDDDGYAKIFQPHGRLTIALGFTDITFSPIDGTYPSWRRVLPVRPVSAELAQYDPKRLIMFRKFGDALSLPLPFVAHNGDGPALVWFPGRPDSMGVVMPYRTIDETKREPPEWARRSHVPDDGDQFDLEDVLDASPDKTEEDEQPSNVARLRGGA